MKMKFVFDDWNGTEKNCYSPELFSGDFYAETTFDGKIKLNADNETVVIRDNWEAGYRPDSLSNEGLKNYIK